MKTKHKLAALLFATLVTSCGFQATYTSPKTGIKYVITEGEDGKPKLDVAAPTDKDGVIYNKDGIKIERAK